MEPARKRSAKFSIIIREAPAGLVRAKRKVFRSGETENPVVSRPSIDAMTESLPLPKEEPDFKGALTGVDV